VRGGGTRETYDDLTEEGKKAILMGERNFEQTKLGTLGGGKKKEPSTKPANLSCERHKKGGDRNSKKGNFDNLD